MKYRGLLQTTYWAGFFLALHAALTVYINSSYLSTKLPESLIGMLYTAAAIISVVGLFLIPIMINKFGTSRVIGGIILANIANLLAMILSPNIAIVATCFVLYFALTTSLYLGIDIIIEHWSASSVQGSVRGSYLTFLSIGYMIAPFLAGFITDRLGFTALYGFAIILLIPAGIILTIKLPSITHTHASKANIISLARKFMSHRDFSAVFFVNFILQFFYAWMVIYTPIYLHEHAGISWDKIGILFTIMLSAFVLFQYLMGKLADRFHVEKKMMMLGLLIMGIATFFVTKAPLLSFWALASVLFVTRVGASMLEVMTESYFFKHVHHDDTGSIGFFRNTYPFAYLIAPLFASLILGFAPMKTLFIILGIICCLGIFIVRLIPKRHI